MGRDLPAAARVIADYTRRRHAVRAVLLEGAVALRAQDFTPDDRPAPERDEGWDANDPENWPPPGHDPTGEAAIHPNRARAMLGQVELADGLVSRAAQIYDRVLGETVDAKGLDRTALAKHVSGDGEPGCQSCARLNVGTETGRVPWWSPPDYNDGRPTDLGGLLPAAWMLCRACQRFTVENDRPPTPKELATKRDTSRWPKRHGKSAA